MPAGRSAIDAEEKEILNGNNMDKSDEIVLPRKKTKKSKKINGDLEKKRKSRKESKREKQVVSPQVIFQDVPDSLVRLMDAPLANDDEAVSDVEDAKSYRAKKSAVGDISTSSKQPPNEYYNNSTAADITRANNSSELTPGYDNIFPNVFSNRQSTKMKTKSKKEKPSSRAKKERELLQGIMMTDKECEEFVIKNKSVGPRPFSTFSAVNSSDLELEDLRHKNKKSRSQHNATSPLSNPSDGSGYDNVQITITPSKDDSCSVEIISPKKVVNKHLQKVLDKGGPPPQRPMTFESSDVVNFMDEGSSEVEETIIPQFKLDLECNQDGKSKIKKRKKRKESYAGTSKWKRRRRRCISCFKSFIAFLFSHIGLCFLVVAYTFCGGWLFLSLEQDNSIKHYSFLNQEVFFARKELRSAIKNFTLDILESKEQQYIVILEKVQHLLGLSYNQLHRVNEALEKNKLELDKITNNVNITKANLWHNLQNELSRHKITVESQVDDLAELVNKLSSNIPCPENDKTNNNTNSTDEPTGRSMTEYHNLMWKLKSSLDNSKKISQLILKIPLTELKRKSKKRFFNCLTIPIRIVVMLQISKETSAVCKRH